jgi:H+/Cl- antiporter ClcA
MVEKLSNIGQVGMYLVVSTILTTLISQLVIDFYHGAKNTTLNLSIHLQPPSYLFLVLIIVGVAGGSLLIYDVLDMRRKRNSRKATFKEKVRKMQDGGHQFSY